MKLTALSAPCLHQSFPITEKERRICLLLFDREHANAGPLSMAHGLSLSDIH